MSRPFDLQAFLGGAPAETASGQKVLDFKVWATHDGPQIQVMLEDNDNTDSLFSYYMVNGKNGCESLNLVMSTTTRHIEGWINLTEGDIFADEATAKIVAEKSICKTLATIKINCEVEI